MRKKWVSLACALLLAVSVTAVVNNTQVLAKTAKRHQTRRFVLLQSRARRVFDQLFFAKKAAKQAIVAPHGMLPQADFTKRVNALVGPVKADIYVLDTKTGRRLTYYNGGTDFWLASSIKAAILTAIVKENGPLTGALDQEAQAMITYSDNDAATDLFFAAGAFPALQNLWTSLGMSNTVANYNGFGMSSSTAGDQIKLLQHIKTLPAADRDYILNLMKSITPAQRFGIGAMKDPAFKNGWLNGDDGSWYVNSIGFSDKERYLVAILTQNNPDQDSGEKLTSQIAASIIKK